MNIERVTDGAVLYQRLIRRRQQREDDVQHCSTRYDLAQSGRERTRRRDSAESTTDLKRKTL